MYSSASLAAATNHAGLAAVQRKFHTDDVVCQISKRIPPVQPFVQLKCPAGVRPCHLPEAWLLLARCMHVVES